MTKWYQKDSKNNQLCKHKITTNENFLIRHIRPYLMIFQDSLMTLCIFDNVIFRNEIYRFQIIEMILLNIALINVVD